MERWLKFRVVNGATMKTLGFSAKAMEVKYYSKTFNFHTYDKRRVYGHRRW